MADAPRPPTPARQTSTASSHASGSTTTMFGKAGRAASAVKASFRLLHATSPCCAFGAGGASMTCA